MFQSSSVVRLRKAAEMPALLALVAWLTSQILIIGPCIDVTMHFVTKRYELARNITNIGGLRERQRFVVHVELRRLLRYQSVKKFLPPMLEFLFM